MRFLKKHLGDNYAEYLNSRRIISKYIRKSALVPGTVISPGSVLRKLELYKKNDKFVRPEYRIAVCNALYQLYLDGKLHLRNGTSEYIALPKQVFDTAAPQFPAEEHSQKLMALKSALDIYLIKMEKGDTLTCPLLCTNINLPFVDGPPFTGKYNWFIRSWLKLMTHKQLLTAEISFSNTWRYTRSDVQIAPAHLIYGLQHTYSLE